MSVKLLLVLILTLLSLVVFAARSYRRLRHLRHGQSADPLGDWGERLKGLGRFFFGQVRLFRYRRPGLAHFFIFWGFLVLFTTIVQAVLEGLFPHFVLPFFGTFGPLALLQDLLACVVIAAVLYGLYLRWIVRPERYEGSHTTEGVVVLLFILAIMSSLLVMNAVRRNLGEAPIEAAVWQPVSAAVGSLLAGVAPSTQRIVAEIAYWIHLGVVLVFLPMLPGGKHFHVVTSLFSVLLRDLRPLGRLPEARRFGELPGVGKVEQFSWRRMLDWYTCTECGRCQDVCPAYQSGLPLSPKKLIMGLRAHLDSRSPAGESTGNGEGPSLTDDVIPQEMWGSCTTCLACDAECPLFVDHVTPIVDMRRHALAKGCADNELMTALTHLRRYGNSFGLSERKRAAWTRGLRPQKVKDTRKQAARTLWFVGDYASYSPSLTEATLATARILERAGVDYGILYDGERNSGNDVRRVGEEGLFEMLRMKNRNAMEACEYEEVVTTDPHTYNALKNEYEANGSSTPVLHLAELIDREIEGGALQVQRPLNRTVTYHDPCYLGRYNGVYEAPRRILERIGCRVIEMERTRDRALCCGAGGGRIWMEEGALEERPSEARLREAASLEGVEVLVVACPKDLTMFRDAAKTVGVDDEIAVVDIAQLIDEATGEPVPDGASKQAAARQASQPAARPDKEASR